MVFVSIEVSLFYSVNTHIHVEFPEASSCVCYIVNQDMSDQLIGRYMFPLDTQQTELLLMFNV